MPLTLPSERHYRSAAIALGGMTLALLGGCASLPAPEEHASVPTRPSPTLDATSPSVIPAVRQGRYTLVELAPEPAQRDLMSQVIDISLPASEQTMVGDGLRYLLRYSGYRLCADEPAQSVLYAEPLPAAHMHLGPLTLRDALLTVAGSAWDLCVDEVSRQVCFTRANEACTFGISGTSLQQPFADRGAERLRSGQP
ncbi:PilL N-terminal domain-containing protein [Xanthomonas oryzae pv. oryzicola]|uniref:PFGI-1 class ICE element type IV pilus protein PilL2 n=1 Tax=Xanthomonas oryzae TaxID=347 RepID=UPI003D170E92